MKRYLIVFFISISTLASSFAQKGKQGDITVTLSNTIVNEYTYLTFNASLNGYTLKVFNSALNTNARFNSNLSEGDLILIIQMQGAIINTSSSDSSFGTVTNYNRCGNYEFAEVSSVPDGNTIITKCALTNNYIASGKTQIIRIPRYKNLTLTNAGSITCPAWDGQTGGIVAMETDKTCSIDGSIDVSAKGFRGAATSIQNGGGGTVYYTIIPTEGAAKGESIAGSYNDYTSNNFPFAMGAPANGGGGGNSSNAGGGGGSNMSGPGNTLYTGNGVPDTSNSSWINAWNLEYANFASINSFGGGRGGYTLGQNDEDALTTAPGNGLWGGDNRRAVGGKGGHPLIYDSDFSKLFLGGGGGAGEDNEGRGGNGGNGGGIVYLLSHGIISGTGTVLANGENGASSLNDAATTDGAGGGGGGGIIILNALDTISGITAEAKGGNGGDSQTNNPAATVSRGAGGGGSGGIIATNVGSIITSITGGANGICTATAVSEFPANGATKGGVGYSTNSLGSKSLKVSAVKFKVNNVYSSKDTIGLCKNDSIIITAFDYTLATQLPVVWYDSIISGNIVASPGNELVVKNLTKTTTYYAELCPGSISRKAITVIKPPTSPTFTAPFAVCNYFTNVVDFSNITPDSTGIFKGKGVFYDTTLSKYRFKPALADTFNNTITYVITSSYGCVDSVQNTIYVHPTPTLSLQVPNYCNTNDTVTLTQGSPSGGAYDIYDELTSLPITVYNGNKFIPNSLTVGRNYVVRYTYMVALSCSYTTYDTILALSAPTSTISSNNPKKFCQGSNVTLTASAGTQYLWSNGATTNSITTDTSGIYFVTITGANSCTSRSQNDTVLVYPKPTPSFNISTTACEGGYTYLSNISPDTQGVFKWYDTNKGSGVQYYAIDHSYRYDNSDTGQHTISYIYTTSFGCIDSTQQSIYIYPAPNVVLSMPSDICSSGDSITLSFGQPANGQYSIYNIPSGTIVNGAIANNTTLIPTALTLGQQYQIRYLYIDNKSCANSDFDTITIVPGPSANISTSGSTTFCQGGNVTLTGSGGLNYSWSNSSTTTSINVNTTGTYTLVTTDNSTCSASKTISVTVNPKPTVSLSLPSSSICSNNSSFTLSGGSPAGGSYFINNNPAASFDPSTQNTGINSIKYIYTDVNGCVDSSSQNLTLYTAPNTPTVSASGNTTFCQGGSVTLTCQTNGVNYLWSNGNTSNAINVSSSGNYFVTITDGNSCTSSSTSSTITVNLLPTALIIPTGNTTFCAGQNVILSAGGGVSYLWSTGSTANTLTVTTANTYSLTVTDNNNCTNSSSINIIVNPLPSVNYTPSTSSICSNASSLPLTGGTPAGGNYSGTGVNNNSFDPSQASIGSNSINYSYTDGNNCSASASQTIIVNQAPNSPIITNTGSTNFCEGDSVLLTSSVANGNSWSNGATGQSIYANTSGAFSVSVSSNGCTATSNSIQVNETTISTGIASPLVNSNYNVSHNTNDGSITLSPSGGTSPYNYQWSNGSTNQNLSNLSAGIYSVIVTDNNGCISSASIILLEAPAELPLEMPQGISPNGDGKNDLFIIHGLSQLNSNTLTIVNRWGNDVYMASPYKNDWNGKNNNGDDLPDGTYFVTLKNNSGEIVLKGYVEIRR